MRLHINRHFNTGWLAKELLGSFNGKTFNFVNKFAAAVVALARIPSAYLLVRQLP